MRTLLSLGLLALLSACAVQPGPRYDSPGRSGSSGPYDDYYDYYGSPLEARIVDVDGRILVQTSRPAYVAIFEIVPGQGVGLLYPGYMGESNYLSGGLNSLWIGRTRSYYGYFAPPTPYGYRSDQPRYLYLVASERPLRTSQLLRHPGLLRSSLGMHHFSAWNPRSILPELDALVLRDGYGEWTSDLFAIWPQRRYDDRIATTDWIRVRCRDGRIIEGPAYYVYGACGQSGNLAPPMRQDPPPARGEPEDSVRIPSRRRPEPVNRQPRTADEEERRMAPPATRPEPIRPEPRREPIRPESRREPIRPQEESRPSPQPVEPIRVEPRREEPRPEPIRPEPRREPIREPQRAEPIREERPEPRPEPIREERPQPRPEPIREERPQPRPEPIRESRPESRPEPRAEPVRPEPPRQEAARPAMRPEPDPR